MSKIPTITFVLSLLIGTALNATVNIVPNGSFENGDPTPSFWNLGGGASSAEATSYEGSTSLKITGSGALAATTQLINLRKNADYNVSVWVKATGMTSGPAVFDTQDAFDGAGQAQFVIRPGDADSWREYTGSFNSGNKASITLRMFTEGSFSGTVFFDAIDIWTDTPLPIPNIVTFIVDDMNKEHFGCFTGGSSVLTPNIDKLASEGIKFQEAYVSSTVCTPSRYTFITGRHPQRSERATYLQEWPIDTQGSPSLNNTGIGSTEQTMGHVLGDLYYKGWNGKTHLGSDEGLTYTSKLTGNTVSEYQYIKDYYDHVLATYESKGNYDAKLNYLKNGATTAFKEIETLMRQHVRRNFGFDYANYLYTGNMEKPFTEHNMEWTIKGGLEFLNLAAQQNKPFHLHINPTLLHGGENQVTDSMGFDSNKNNPDPHEDHVNFPHFSGKGWLNTPIDPTSVGMPTRQAIKNRVANANLHADMAGILWLDEGVGAIMDKLDAMGVTENTIFVFVPDHGTNNKTSMFSKDGSSVPMIIRYPALMNQPGVNKNVSCFKLVQNIDLVPTLLELAGVAIPEDYKVDGKSFAHLLVDPRGQRIHDHLFFQQGHAKAILKDNWKYVVTRFTQKRIDKVMNNIESGAYGNLNSMTVPPENLVTDMGYMGSNYGITKRGMQYNCAFLDFDQLYDMGPRGKRNDKAEAKEGTYTKNLLKSNVSDGVRRVEKEMKKLLEEELTHMNYDHGQQRPYGEFDTGYGPGTKPVIPSRMMDYHQKVYGYYRDNFNTGANPSDPYIKWKLNRSIAGDSGDDDMDGLPNLMEYYMGGNLNGPDYTKLPKTIKSGNDLRFSFYRGSADVTHRVQLSNNLTRWRTFTTNPGNPDSNVNVTIPQSEFDGKDIYVRLIVEQ